MSERQVHTSLVTQLISRLFPGKSNEIKGQFGFESVFVDNECRYDKVYQNYFCKGHLEK